MIVRTFFTILTIALVTLNADPITFNQVAGDIDFGADRNAFDIASNMDFYVFAPEVNISGDATNNKGIVLWDYTLPNEIETAFSGEMTVRTWDIDQNDQMDVYFDLGEGNRIFAGELTGSNGGNVTSWENAVDNGTTADLNGWSTTTFYLNDVALDALSNTSGFELVLDVQNNESVSTNWAAVIDYAEFTLNYEPGAPNPGNVPEPATMFLLGCSFLGLFGMKRIQKK